MLLCLTSGGSYFNWFCKQDLNTNMQTRSTKAPYKPVQARTQRLLNSPIPYFTQLLNADATKTNNVPWTLQVLTVVVNMLVLVDNSSRHWYPYQLHLSLSSYWCTVVNHSLLSCNNKPILLWMWHQKIPNIARGTTDPGYWLFNLSYLSS